MGDSSPRTRVQHGHPHSSSDIINNSDPPVDDDDDGRLFVPHVYVCSSLVDAHVVNDNTLRECGGMLGELELLPPTAPPPRPKVDWFSLNLDVEKMAERCKDSWEVCDLQAFVSRPPRRDLVSGLVRDTHWVPIVTLPDRATVRIPIAVPDGSTPHARSKKVRQCKAELCAILSDLMGLAEPIQPSVSGKVLGALSKASPGSLSLARRENCLLQNGERLPSRPEIAGL